MSEPTPPVASSTLEYYRPMPVPEPPAPRQRYWLHALLLLATCFTHAGDRRAHAAQLCAWAGLLSLLDGSDPLLGMPWALRDPARLLVGLPFQAR